ncbi:GNAT family N-acetyltransferase [Flavobacteriaceae bacterium AU392]|nr:GNAT family N-acetyltransferase [Flavobacteriaceae bacterium]RKM86115.1 GNAT family N-acetyltransferase [Flavobacteriaceae bacterium AU392]
MSINNIIIREIQPQDNAILETLIRSIFIEFEISLVNSTFEDEEMLNLFDFYQGNREVFYVIEMDYKIVGGGGIKPLLGGDGDICELQKMYFLPELRGKGYGKVILEKCLNIAREMGYEKCYLESGQQLTTAISLYEKIGFKHLTEPLGNTGHHSCNIWMLKDL